MNREEWLQARVGSLGASSLHEAIARTKSGWGASRANLRDRLVVERLTGVAQEGFQNDAMRRGVEMEPKAAAMYGFLNGVDLEGDEPLLFPHPGIVGTHASPDRLVGLDGLLEVKCPNTSTHIDTLLGAPIADRYVVQMQWQMACTGREWCDFASFDDRLPPHMALHVRRVRRDDEAIAALEAMVRAFLADVEERLAAVRAL